MLIKSGKIYQAFEGPVLNDFQMNSFHLVCKIHNPKKGLNDL